MEPEDLASMPGPCRKRVMTPYGERTLVVDYQAWKEEVDAYVANFHKPDSDILCKRCGGEATYFTVKHPLCRHRFLPCIPELSILEDLEDADSEDPDVHTRVVPFCLKCDMVPDPIGEPLAVEGSYFNKPH